MTAFKPRNAEFEARVRESFSRQSLMTLFGAELVRVRPGEVEVELPQNPALLQQHGFFHAGVTTSIADTAAGYAALTLFKPDSEVLTTEYKVNLLAPAKGEKLVARGRVLKPGRTLTICKSDVVAMADGGETLVATALLTMIQVENLKD
ncbi:MAG: PaaI family thioesterase [Hyphomicrobiales bacterium]